MTIHIPVLDDRSFDQLVARGHGPDRGPHAGVDQPQRLSDPGITIIELFAFLTENLLYRSNRIPEANRLKFLSMLGISLQPAVAGPSAWCRSATTSGPLHRRSGLPAGTEVRAGQVPFLTRTPLAVLPVTAAAYYKSAAARRTPPPSRSTS